MADRAAREALIREVYDSRIRGDVDGILRHLDDDIDFSIAGCAASSVVPCSVQGAAALRGVMSQLVSTFEFSNGHLLDMLLEGDRAVVHWRVQVRAPGTGDQAETEFVDLVQFRGNKISSFKQFADTALAGRLLGSGRAAAAQPG